MLTLKSQSYTLNRRRILKHTLHILRVVRMHILKMAMEQCVTCMSASFNFIVKIQTSEVFHFTAAWTVLCLSAKSAHSYSAKETLLLSWRNWSWCSLSRLITEQVAYIQVHSLQCWHAKEIALILQKCVAPWKYVNTFSNCYEWNHWDI